MSPLRKIRSGEVVLDGKSCFFEYEDADSFESLETTLCRQVYAVCLFEDKIIIGKTAKGGYMLIGGKREDGESYEQALRREVAEETNMKVDTFRPLGFQRASLANGEDLQIQLRYVCVVSKIGEFVSDPDEDIVELIFVEPQDFTKYLKWGEIGERIVERAMELKTKLD